MTMGNFKAQIRPLPDEERAAFEAKEAEYRAHTVYQRIDYQIIECEKRLVALRSAKEAIPPEVGRMSMNGFEVARQATEGWVPF